MRPYGPINPGTYAVAGGVLACVHGSRALGDRAGVQAADADQPAPSRRGTLGLGSAPPGLEALGAEARHELALKLLDHL